jgi:hypothetical protein
MVVRKSRKQCGITNPELNLIKLYSYLAMEMAVADQQLNTWRRYVEIYSAEDSLIDCHLLVRLMEKSQKSDSDPHLNSLMIFVGRLEEAKIYQNGKGNYTLNSIEEYVYSAAFDDRPTRLKLQSREATEIWNSY